MPSRTRNPIENSLRVGSNRKLKSISRKSCCAWSLIARSRRTRFTAAAGPSPVPPPGLAPASPVGGSDSSAIVGNAAPVTASPPPVTGDAPVPDAGPNSARSRTWLCTARRVASAQATSSLSEPSPRSAVSAAATSASVPACAARSARRAAHAPDVAGRTSPAPSGSSKASSSCRRVSVWLRRSLPIPPAASRARASASPIPASAAATGSGSSIMSRHAFDSVMRWPARLPLSTDETYAGSSRWRSRVSYQL